MTACEKCARPTSHTSSRYCRTCMADTPPAWSRAIEAYIAFRRLEGLATTSLRLREYHLRRMSHEVGVNDPYAVTITDLTTWMGGPTWTIETFRSVRSTIYGFFSWAVKTRRMSENPAADLPKPKMRVGRPKPVPEDDYAAALAAANPRVRMALRLGGDLGMRRAEIAQVHEDDLIETPAGYMLRIVGKGSKERVIPIGSRLATDLVTWIKEHGRGGWAFPSAKSDGHITPHWLGTLLSNALPEGYTGHKLRHRALTQAHRRSGDLLLTSKLAGHSNVSTTAQYYVEADYTAMRAVVEGIAS